MNTNGRLLTLEELTFCLQTGLEHGFDVDDNEHQFQHICWPGVSGLGSLCQSDRLWGRGPFGTGNTLWAPDWRVDCESCLSRFEDLKSKDPLLLAVIGRLAAVSRSLHEVDLAATNFLWVQDHPEQARELPSTQNSYRNELDVRMDSSMAELTKKFPLPEWK